MSIDRARFVAAAMDRVRAAVRDAPSHEEFHAGIEAALHCLTDPEAVLAEADAADQKAADEAAAQQALIDRQQAGTGDASLGEQTASRSTSGYEPQTQEMVDAIRTKNTDLEPSTETPTGDNPSHSSDGDPAPTVGDNPPNDAV